MPALNNGSATAPSAMLLTHQRSEADDKLLYALIDWLLPHLRLKMPEKASRWDNFWRLFRADGTMTWDDFERYLRYDCKLSPRKLFELLDITGSGRISSKTVLEVRREYERIIDCRHSGLDDLRVILMRKYGNLMRAWRKLFDRECRGRCGHNWYVKSCKEIGYHGDLKSAWNDLTNGDVHRPMTPADLDPAADQHIREFVTALGRCHGTPRDGWYAIMRAHGHFGRMDVDGFERVCQEMGVAGKLGKKVFSYVDADSSKSISLDEWEFLQLWENCAEESGAAANQQGRANIGGAPMAARELGSPGSDVGSPKKKTAWGAAVDPNTGENAFDLQDGTGAAEAAAVVEFHVVLTKEEHKEYLRRRRELEMQSLASARTAKLSNNGTGRAAPKATRSVR